MKAVVGIEVRDDMEISLDITLTVGEVRRLLRALESISYAEKDVPTRSFESIIKGSLERFMSKIEAKGLIAS